MSAVAALEAPASVPSVPSLQPDLFTPAVAISATSTAPQPVLPSTPSLMPYQIDGVAALAGILPRFNGALLADDMGLGKTPQAISLVNTMPQIKRVLVVCPALVKINWAREWATWSTRSDLRVGIQAAGKPWVGDLCAVTIINYDILCKFEAELAAGFDLVVADESHYVKNASAKRSKALFAIPCRYKLALSGTPIVNRPVEIFPVLKWLDRQTWSNWKAFVERYCDAYQSRFGWVTDGASNIEELQTKLRGTLMVRREKKDVLKDLPEKRRSLIYLAAPAAIRKASQALTAEIPRELFAVDATGAAGMAEAVAKIEEVVSCHFTEMARFWSLCADAKLAECLGFIKDLLEGGCQKVVVFSHHVALIEGIQKGLAEYGAVAHYGGLSPEEKQKSVDRFQLDPGCRVFSGSTLASVEGITLTAAHTVCFCEGDWRPGKISQGEDRCHRFGQRNAVDVFHLVFADTLDALMAQTVVKKQEILDRLTSAERAALWAAEPKETPWRGVATQTLAACNAALPTN